MAHGHLLGFDTHTTFVNRYIYCWFAQEEYNVSWNSNTTLISHPKNTRLIDPFIGPILVHLFMWLKRQFYASQTRDAEMFYLYFRTVLAFILVLQSVSSVVGPDLTNDVNTWREATHPSALNTCRGGRTEAGRAPRQAAIP